MWQKFLVQEYWGNTGHDYFMVAVIFIAAVIVLKIFQLVIIARLKSMAKKTATDFDDVLIEIFDKLKPPFYILVALYIAVVRLSLAVVFNKAMRVVFLLAVLYELNGAMRKLLRYGIKKAIRKRTSKQDYASEEEFQAEVDSHESMIQLVANLSSVGLWAMGLILVLSNLGVNVTSLVAGLGIGGIAIALALQNILSDLFSSISIMVDKPFKVGDFIIIGSDMGTVEKIGVKTTRIRTLQGQELTVANKELTSTRINNYGRMEKRRVLFELGVIYETPAAKLKKIPEIIKSVVTSVKKTEFDRAHFKAYGDFSLNFESVYYVLSADYAEYMDIQQTINLKIFEAFKKEGIEFAYPTSVEYQKKF